MDPINLWKPCYSAKVTDDPQTYTLDIVWLEEEESEEEEEEEEEKGEGGEGFPSKGTLPQRPLHGYTRKEMFQD